jgi:hypothetical protein
MFNYCSTHFKDVYGYNSAWGPSGLSNNFLSAVMTGTVSQKYLREKIYRIKDLDDGKENSNC